MSAEKVKDTLRQNCDEAVSILRDIHQQLRFQQAMGITEYPLNEEIQCFLKFKYTSSRKEVRTNIRRETVGATSVSRATGGGSELSVLAALQQEIGQCTLCHLATSRLGTIPGRGTARSRLMMVGDWSSQEQDYNPKILFGAAEDGMLWKMMEAIDLRPEEVYVTNILKCCPGAGQVPDQKCRENCFSYLVREIGAVKPSLICAMGDLAVSMLLGSTEPLFRLRGRFALYRYQSVETIPVMPTFHPRYLLRNPEMKMATWKDLQAVRRRLEQIGS